MLYFLLCLTVTCEAFVFHCLFVCLLCTTTTKRANGKNMVWLKLVHFNTLPVLHQYYTSSIPVIYLCRFLHLPKSSVAFAALAILSPISSNDESRPGDVGASSAIFSFNLEPDGGHFAQGRKNGIFFACLKSLKPLGTVFGAPQTAW